MSAAAVGVLEAGLEEHRAALTGYCYRMLGSLFEAEDAVQETMLRAWRALDRYEGRSTLRTWLFSIATNVCLDQLAARAGGSCRWTSGAAGRPRPSPPSSPDHLWVEPVPDDRVLPEGGDPAAVAAARDTIRLAFVAALQHLQPRQRAVLLRDVLGWRSAEVADLLGTTTVAVKSTLQRARATMAERDPAARPRSDRLQGEDRAAGPLRGGLRALRHRGLVALLRGRHPVHAPAPAVGAGPRADSTVVVRAPGGVRREPAGAGGRQRIARAGRVPPRPRREPRSVRPRSSTSRAAGSAT